MNLARFHTAPVLLDLARLQAATAEELRLACRRLGARPVDWRSDQPDPHPPAAALVSGLRWGERSLPEELLLQLEAGPRRLPLLVVCAEPLVAPSVTLHDGLVTLAGPALRRLYGELRRVLLRAAGGASADDLGGQDVVERCAPGVWGAAAAALLHCDDRGVSSLVPLEEGAALEPAFLAFLAAEPLAAREAAAALAQAVGPRAGLVALRPTAREWLIYWPSATAPLWLCSDQRLPGVTDFRLAPGARASGPVRLESGPGDAVVALGAPPPSGLEAPTVAEGATSWLQHALQGAAGGPGLRAVAIEALS